MNDSTTRRGFLRNAALLASAMSAPAVLRAAPDGYSGPLLVVLQAAGGWDVTSYCDPKGNITGERVINHWAENAEPQTAGNIEYAPFANNAWFFERHRNNILVINGVDAQTNSHSTGVLHNWSGRNARGFPSLTALFAARHAPTLPLSYLSYGGFSDTANLIRFSRLDSVTSLRQILTPELNPGVQGRYDRDPADVARIRAAHAARLERQLARPAQHPRARSNLAAYRDASAGKAELARFADFVPAADDVLPRVTVNEQVTTNLQAQIQLTIAAFDAGVASAADLQFIGFDTHQQHDTRHEPLLTHLNESLDLLWRFAAERAIADRLTVVVGSDFGRTPRYNADDGKDHWPIGSVVVMADAPAWGNRVVGRTDEGHNAVLINPLTLAEDTGGERIYPKDVHAALRRQLGIDTSAVAAGFPLADSQFDFFG